MTKTKICGRCKKKLPVSEFNKCHSKKDGLQYRCKGCQIDYQKVYQQTENGKATNIQSTVKYIAKHKEKVADYQADYRQKNSEYIKVCWQKYHDTIDGYLHILWSSVEQRGNITTGLYTNVRNLFESFEQFYNHCIEILGGRSPIGLDLHRIDKDYEPWFVIFLTPEDHALAHKKIRALAKAGV